MLYWFLALSYCLSPEVHAQDGISVLLVPDTGATTEIGQGDQRWKDIADNLYDAAYFSDYRYEQANVTLIYQTNGATFTGRLLGRNLKPFHAYQVKFFAPAGSPSMESIGRLGRWWAGGNPLNVSDEFYEANKTTIAFESFLIFDYFITDGEGKVDKALSLDSTYHVLWRFDAPEGAPGQRQPAEEDGPVLSVEVAPSANLDPDGNPATPSPYSAEGAPLTISVYGERENTAGNVRPLPGQAKLAPGQYQAQFILTEEGFHSFGANSGGNYASVLRSPEDQDVSFSVSNANEDEAGSSSDDQIEITAQEDNSGQLDPGSGACFIATAVFESQDDPTVQALRRFRDRALLPSELGGAFVRTYYGNSPTAARHLEHSLTVCGLMRSFRFP